MRFTIDQPDLVVAPGLVVERYNRTLRYDWLNKFLAESIHRAVAPALPCLRFGRSINYQLIPVRLGICCKLLQPLSVNTELIFAGFPEYWLKDRCSCG